MPDTKSITIVKKFTYRGKREEFSNKYHLSGTTPSDAAGWKTLADAIIELERPLMRSAVTFVRAYGYEAGNEVSVAQIDYEAPPLTPKAGSANVFPNQQVMQPESSVMLRSRTPERNTRKKWIYLRKYFHGSVVNADGETIAPEIVTAGNTFLSKMTDGTLPGGAKWCGPQGATAGAGLVDPFAVSRELKRRGKRPSR